MEIDFCFISFLCRKRINFCDGVEDVDLIGVCERRFVEVFVIEVILYLIGFKVIMIKISFCFSCFSWYVCLWN